MDALATYVALVADSDCCFVLAGYRSFAVVAVSESVGIVSDSDCCCHYFVHTHLDADSYDYCWLLVGALVMAAASQVGSG